MTAFVIAGALSWIGRWYQPGGEYSAEDVAKRCIDTLLAGVLLRGDLPATGPQGENPQPSAKAVKVQERTETHKPAAARKVAATAGVAPPKAVCKRTAGA